jgi:nitrate/nitrite transport system substrate-binding protein
MGLAGSPVKPMVIPWLLNRNGQAITLNNKMKAAGVRTPAALKPLVDKAKAAGDPMTFAMTFPTRYPRDVDALLARVGRHPSGQGREPHHDSAAQMVANMKVDKMDGFCVGEPWNNRAIRRRHRLHGRDDAADLEGPSGKGLRVHRRVRHEEPRSR